MQKKKICVLTGAGMSAESGIKTFRDEDGLWEGHDVMQVASPQGWLDDPELVLDFYNQRRRQLEEVLPNLGHLSLVSLEEKFNTVIVTQNVDDLHERAGSTNVLHLHGELLKVRSTGNLADVRHWSNDLCVGDKCEAGFQLRPHIVWFGEEVPAMIRAVEEISTADIVFIIGTSMVVYPAAGLVHYAPPQSAIYYCDPKPNISYELSLRSNLKILEEKATSGVPQVVHELLV